MNSLATPHFQSSFLYGCALAAVFLAQTATESPAAVTIDFTAGPGEPFLVSSGGSVIPDSNIVEIGYFDDGFDVTANASDIVTLSGSFNVFGSTAIREIATESGRFGGFASKFDAVNDAHFDGKRLYMMAYLTTGNTPPNKPTFDNVLEYGVFTNTSLTDWLIPAQGSSLPTTLVGSSQVSTAEHGAINGATSLALAAVPEPSTTLLLLGGWSFILLGRRRHGRNHFGSSSARLLNPFIFTALIGSLAINVSRASVTIDYTAQAGQRDIVNHAENLIEAGGGEVRVGVLSDHFDPVAHGGDLQRLRESWIALGSTSIRDISGDKGRFSAATTFDRPELAGAKLYLWVLATADGETIRKDYANVVDYGLYSSTTAQWTVPSSAAIPPENHTIINTSQIDQRFGPGDYTLSSLRITRPLPVSLDYESWAKLVFPINSPKADQQEGADPDNDGRSNRLELFTGTDPLIADSQPVVSLSQTDDGMVLTFERSKKVKAAAGSIEFSSNLKDWVAEDIESDALEVEASVDPNSERVRLRLRMGQSPEKAMEQLFYRLHVRQE